ncbi:peptidase U35 phage prohead HK97 [Elusimicrobium minutum Pei191]|uniref:Peptidase U35 phage prohead HK97 n=1 Tax=Elusimicrobium minutum (strain Pei191) TaxID=445932 RepID=B2KCK5_ELUMP|nr:HK97 family phage prohead protease [Elusimicrobium minutum]ACC98251.1 peptidase U35 phage prohead HK97 [Elusimicrobium minutum Pei191]
MKHIIKGTKVLPAVKILPISEVKITETSQGLVYIQGYANTKNKADRYGDIPTVYHKKRDYVYELKHFAKNPVLLIDHVNRIDHLAGSVVNIREDDKGLYFKAVFSTSGHPIVAHARHIYKEGHAKGISIAGRFHFEDNDNPSHLTYAEIYEISLVAVPADPDSLAQAVEKTIDEAENEKNIKLKLQEEIDAWLTALNK